MQIFDKGKVYDFMSYKHFSLVISLLLIIASIFFMITRGFNYGIDFSGGTLIQVKYDSVAPISVIRDKFNEVEALKNASVTEFGSKEEITIRYSSSTSSINEDPAVAMTQLLKDTGNFEIRRVDIVGPKVGDELRKSGLMALSISIILILIYLAVRFEWKFAIAAIVSEFHDVIITLGVISFFQIDVNLDILAAILTIVGYSLNDTIIVFDRIREGIKESKNTDLICIINESVSKTLSRTILTSFTTFISVFILYLFGGDMINGFSFVVLVGVIVGTLSSVFIAAQALLWFGFNVIDYRNLLEQKQKKKKEKERMRALYEKGTI